MKLNISFDVTIGNGAHVELTDRQQAKVKHYIESLLTNGTGGSPGSGPRVLGARKWTPKEIERVRDTIRTFPEAMKERRKVVATLAKELYRTPTACKVQINLLARMQHEAGVVA